MEKTNRGPVIYGTGHITDHDIYLFKEGSHFNLYNILGSHIAIVNGVRGADFAVWAPDAQSVSVVGDFNGWDPCSHPLRVRDDWSGIWEGFIPSAEEGMVYKYHIVSRHSGYRVDKADPYSFYCERPPKTASIVRGLGYTWGDSGWMEKRGREKSLNSPISIYELHPGSWMRVPGEGGRYLNYRELAVRLADYVVEMGFTHVELTPVMEHPFYGSWGYQTTGYFAPTSRFGTPQDFMYFVDLLHQRGIGVILDWVPSHFPSDEHGIGFFDGTHLYEHADPRKGFHPDWNSFIFNYGRNEVRSFLISSALFWLDTYHVDGIRVDAVASMLYLDYSRKEGEWIPNEFGGRENLEAVSLIRRLNEAVYEKFPDVHMIAEESTSWPAVSRPVYLGGLGFGMKWNMGWMHDTIEYFRAEPLFRKYRHNDVTFSLWYAFSENFVLPFSHDEVVHGKGSMLGKMPGDEWQRFANLRLLYGLMYGHPGKKLLFMGCEFGQVREWTHEESLEWHVLEYPLHSGMKLWVGDLNRLYRSEPSLYELDFVTEGFRWVDNHNWEESILCFLRNSAKLNDNMLVICNFTPVVRSSYRVGVPYGGFWRERLNSDGREYGGSGVGNTGGATADPIEHNGYPFSIEITLPPLAALFFKAEG
ncbi:MAG: 1,4-alpha-glucan branching protein GlgB [Thermodesulfobacteriota bacterium]